ncbi:MAG: right-handed parallel beta-helix repeat-containing protein [Bacteroidales bacterium]|nr:right-handed parallel beta-helix repeat-containing protein [Bacteroidales bacterium]
MVTFEPGRYDFWPEDAVRRDIFISNTSSEVECPSKEKVIGVLIEGQNGLTVDGHGATLVFHGKQTMIAIIGSENVTLKNLHIDCERPGGSELTYIGFNPGGEGRPPYTDVRFHKDSWYSIDDDGVLELVGEGWKTEYPHCIELNATNGHFVYSKGWEVLHSSKAVEIGPGLVRFETPEGFVPTIGNTLTVRDRIRDQVGILNMENNGVNFEDCNIHYMHGLGIVSQFSKDVTMRRVYCTPREESGRVLASSADFMHFSGCRGHVRVLDCRFSGAHDDPINVHGTNLRIVAADPSSRLLKLRFMHHQTYGLSAFHSGDKVALVHAETLQRYSYARVKSVRRLSDREVEITLNRYLPKDIILDSDVVENMTWTPRVEIRGNHFTRTSTRGVLLTTPRKSVIADNTFLKTGMAAVLVAGDARDWFESGPVRNVHIKGNRFIDCCYNSHQSPITIDPSNTVLDKKMPVHGKICVCGNIFEGEMLGKTTENGFSEAIVYAKSTRRLIVSGNITNGVNGGQRKGRWEHKNNTHIISQ